MADVLEILRRSLSDRYRVHRELGAGGWATVYLATDLKHHRDVAMKVLRPEVASAIGLERFVREIEISARLRHPNILPLYDSGEADGLFYYVMPFVEGESLRDVLKRDKQLAADDALRIAQEVADALALAHSQGVVHRDIKPENILLDAGHAVVADFGIATAVLKGDSSRLTGSGIAVGTPAYMSPEQALGESELDARSDIYSLGCVTYEMLTGEPPFDGATVQAIIARHMTGVIPRASEVRATIPPSVDAVITKSLAKVPADRFGGAQRMAAALERARAELDTATAGRSSSPSFPLPLTWIALVVVVVLAVGIGWLVTRAFGDSTSSAYDSPVLVIPPFSSLARDSSQDYVVAGITEAVKTELAKVGDLAVVSGTPERLSEDDARGALVLYGSVHSDGNRVRITARLEEASTGRNVWGEDYDGNLNDIFALYADIARAISHEVEAELTPEEEARLQDAPLVDPEAYNHYLRGRFFWNRRSPSGLLRAVEYFERAIETDSGLALGYAGLADAYILFPQYRVPDVSDAEAYRRAEQFAQLALERDSTLGEAMTALARVRFIAHRDWLGADSLFTRALSLSPGYGSLHQWYGEYLNAQGRVVDGLAEVSKAFQLEPQEPVISYALAWGFWYARRYDEAAEQALHTLSLDSSFVLAYQALALANLGLARYEEMESAALAVGLPAVAVTAIRRALEDETYRANAVQTLDDLSGVLDPFMMAMFYSAIGEKDGALFSLELAESQQYVEGLLYLKSAPIFDFIRDEPRYEALLEKYGIPTYGQ